MSVTIPQAVKIGDTVTLQCHYNLENEPLYTVKWYKGSREFFRYVPKEMPSTREFLLSGISIDVSTRSKSLKSFLSIIHIQKLFSLINQLRIKLYWRTFNPKLQEDTNAKFLQTHQISILSIEKRICTS